MTRRFKWALASLCFLGVNGIVWPFLIDNFKSLNVMKHLGWGGNLRNNRGIKVDNYQLDLGNNKGSNSLFSLENRQDPLLPSGLKLENNQKSNNFLLGATADQEQLDRIYKVFNEINKEGSVSSFMKEMESKYGDLVNKHFGKRKEMIAKDFQTAKFEIKSWVKSNAEVSNRNVPKASLSKEQRNSLKKFYELFAELTSKRKELSTNLSHITEETSPEYPELQSRTPQNILRVLEKINWTGKSIRVEEMVNIDWSKNFYSFFYDKEEDFKKHADSTEQKKEQATRLQGIMSSSAGMWSGYKGQQVEEQNTKELITSLKSNSQSEIEYQVGSKLLEWMGMS